MKNEAAIAAFIAKKAEFDAMLARIAEYSDEHFGETPDAINYSHVGSLAAMTRQLKEIHDCMFNEGEFAA